VIDVEGLACVVTGAGRGIGRSEALELASRGALVLVNDVDASAAASVAAEIRDAGGTAEASGESVSTEAGGAAIIDQVAAAFGRVDVVVNNAGTRRPGYFGRLSADDIDIVLNSHLRAGFHVTQPAWLRMAEQGFGRVLFTSSSSGMFSNQGLSNYAAAKAGLYGLTKALAYEGAALGITVNAILPFADTKRPGEVRVPDMAEHRGRHLPPALSTEVEPWRQDPALIGRLVACLASRTCTVNGEAISACYGRYARVFVGVADGWLAPDAASATAEQIDEHLGEIRDVSHSTVPMWIFDEIADVLRRLQDAG
jgi:NAD(P)-dependent dehydrogenase (short-subunit alcohol dehydrogenase family)